MTNLKITAATLAVAFVYLQTPYALAGGSHNDGHEDTVSIGQPGEESQIDRTIQVEMGEMFFSPNGIDVKAGETIRFVISNTGDFVHEFNIGTQQMHEDHAEEMMMMMENGVLEADRINHAMMNAADMAHDDANSMLLEPGTSDEVIWTFSGTATLEISCNVPGHRESGMRGDVRISDNSA